MSVLGMVLALHALGVLIILALILFGVVSVIIIGESSHGQWKWSSSSHPRTLEMMKKHKEEGMFELHGFKCRCSDCTEPARNVCGHDAPPHPVSTVLCADCFGRLKKS